MAIVTKQAESELDFKRVARSSLSDHIIEQISNMIARGALKPGDRIPSEMRLCAQFGVGRTSVREALRSLTTMGVLETRRGDGTFVAADTGCFIQRSFEWGLLLNRKRVEDLIETRLMLESHTAYLAAATATDGDLEAAQAAVRRMKSAMQDPAEYLENDLQFHLIVARATQNPILLSLLITTRGYLQVWIREALAQPGTAGYERRARLSVTEHERILRALKDRDARSARQAMAAHVLSSSADLKSHLFDQPRVQES